MSLERFPKSNRILLKRDFQFLHDNAQKIVTPYFVLFYKKNSNNNARLAISVQKKFGSAAARNYFKRRIREFFRKNCRNFANFDMHFVVKRTLDNSSKSSRTILLSKDFQYILRKMKNASLKNCISA